jgi:hypothetical protein
MGALDLGQNILGWGQILRCLNQASDLTLVFANMLKVNLEVYSDNLSG